MAETVSQLVTDILEEGSFDATDTQALRWLNRRHKQMCARARLYRKTQAMTRVSAALYSVTGLVEAMAVGTPSQPYSRGRHVDLAGISDGTLPISAGGALYVEREDGLLLYPDPDPDVESLPVSVYGAFEAPDLELDNNPGLLVDADAIEGLLAGVFATALARPGEARQDMAVAYEATFSAACEELRVRVNRRYRGGGPRLIRIVGVNA